MVRREALKCWERIAENKRLSTLEKVGFDIGISRGKTMDVSIEIMNGSVSKQWKDYKWAWENYLRDKSELNRQAVETAIANLRNVAGCMFLKIEEERK